MTKQNIKVVSWNINSIRIRLEQLKKIADKFGLKGLSMGMSSDFEQAIQFGATHVRVGSEIFGSRS